MILYLGTSTLVKLYMEEPYSDAVRDWVREAEIVSTSRIAYTEMVSALDNRYKKRDLSKKEYELLVNILTKDWKNFVTVDFDEIETGRLVRKYGLTRFDAIHLSAAKTIKKHGSNILLFFSSVNYKLCKAAVSEGLRLLNLY